MRATPLFVTLVGITCLSSACQREVGEPSALKSVNLGGVAVSLEMTREQLEDLAKGMAVARVIDSVHVGRPGYRFDSSEATFFVSADHQMLDGVRLFLPGEATQAALLASKASIPGEPSAFKNGENSCRVWKKDGYIRIILVRELKVGRIVQALVMSERASLEILGYAGTDAAEYFKVVSEKYGDSGR